MSVRDVIMAAAGGAASAPLYVDDVFSSYVYQGNGSTQTITNGIDLAGKGGLVWNKCRGVARANFLQDTVKGTSVGFRSESANNYSGLTDCITSFNSNGFTVGADVTYGQLNQNTETEVSWTFRRANKFFDVVAYTGNGSNRTIAHSLGVAPGMIIIKRLDAAYPPTVYHVGIANTEILVLSSTAAKVAASTAWNSTTATATDFSLGALVDVNANTGTYIAYLFAHDTATDGIIQCGSFTTDGSGNATVTLGWEPQFLMSKASSTTSYWAMMDVSRKWTADIGGDYMLQANTSNAEAGPNYLYAITATGFKCASLSASQTYIYLAIRRPNKPPTTGTQVYSAIARTGTGAAATVTGVGFAPDLLVTDPRATGDRPRWWDRLRGANQQIQSVNTNAESTATDAVNSFGMDGVGLGADATNLVNTSAATYINWFFKRAPGVFDVVCYTGDAVGATAQTIPHGLSVAPELIVFKKRSSTSSWLVYHKDIGASNLAGYLNLTNASSSTTAWNSTSPTSSAFTVYDTSWNLSGSTYVAYLFATLAGVSKVGSYTGDGGTAGTTGTSQTINCGFSAGARFVLIKCTSNTGDWFTWDSTRGLVAGNDPHLSLNTTTAEVTTDDSIDPDASGFVVNQLAATNINVNTATYIYLAFA